MPASDYGKAFFLGALTLLLNLLTLVILVFGYGQLIAPGRTQEFYNETALRFGSWSAPIAGAIIIFLLIWLFSRRRPQRNPYVFGGAVFVSYFAIDTATGLMTSSVEDLIRLPFLLGMGSAALGAIAAAYCARSHAAQSG